MLFSVVKIFSMNIKNIKNKISWPGFRDTVTFVLVVAAILLALFSLVRSIVTKQPLKFYTSTFSSEALTDTPTIESQFLKDIPQGIWLVGQDNTNFIVKTTSYLAGLKNENPIFVLYNVPNRDSTGGHSNGGASNSESYKKYVDEVSERITTRSVVIVEPDALADIDTLTEDQQEERYSLVSYAVNTLLKNPHDLKIYVDLGNNGWNDASIMAERYNNLTLDDNVGFSLNVSNFYKTEDVVKYGEDIQSKISGHPHFVIDTSRNGSVVAKGVWCNPESARVGELPTIDTGNSNIDAYLWIKNPGESDGQCGLSDKPAGEWDSKLSESLLKDFGDI